MSNHLQDIIDRIKSGERHEFDIQAIAAAIQAGQLVLVGGSGAVAAGGDVANSQIIPGNGNVLGNGNYVIHLDISTIQTLRSIPCLRSIVAQSFMCNLPQEGYLEFIGRKAELKLLLDYLSPENRRYIITICGVGGVGKTALALNAAHHCWQAKQGSISGSLPIFDAIVFTSAKITKLTPRGVLRRPLREGTLTDILLAIADVLDEQAITQAAPEEQRRLVYECLRKRKTLLIVDNLETIKGCDQDEVLAFLEDLPSGCKAIVTSRKQTLQRTHISLDELPEADCIQLMYQHAAEKEIRLAESYAKRLYCRFGGIPAALIYAVGQRASGHSLKKILNPKALLPDDVAQFCFDSSVQALSESAYRLLLALGIFRGAPTQEAWLKVAGLTLDVQTEITQLKLLSLVKEVEDQQNVTRYRIISLTREYILRKLATDTSDFEEQARQRWVKYYLKFASKHGGTDWRGWHTKYDYLQGELTNLREVLQWCASQQDYETVRDLWWQIDNFIDLYGYWQERLNWLTWLIEMSIQYGDLATHVSAKSEKAWTLLLMKGSDRKQAVEELLKSAWEFSDHVEPEVKAHIANHTAILQMIDENYHSALTWLEIEEQTIQQSDLNGRNRMRHLLQIYYYRAEVYYLQGDFDRAQTLFQEVLQRGKEIGWQRFANYAQNYLADVAIVKQNLENAEQLLKSGLDEARSNSEKRRIAHYQATYARLEQQRGHVAKAREWANKALEGFKVEGMAWDVEQMRAILELE